MSSDDSFEPTLLRGAVPYGVRHHNMHLAAVFFMATALLMPLPAQASDTYGLGEAALLAMVYAALLVLHLVACLVAMIRTRSWRPLLVLPISLAFAAALLFVATSLVPSGPLVLPLLLGVPLLAVPLAIIVYRDLFRRKAATGASGA